MPVILTPDGFQDEDKGEHHRPVRQLDAEFPVVEPLDPLYVRRIHSIKHADSTVVVGYPLAIFHPCLLTKPPRSSSSTTQISDGRYRPIRAGICPHGD